MNKTYISNIIILLIAAVAMAAFMYFSGRPHYAWLDFYTGKVEVRKADKKIEAAAVKKKLFHDDVVKTFGNSTAFIQCGADNMAQVFENSEIRMSSLPKKLASSDDTTIFNLVAGGAGFFVDVLTDKGSFEVRTMAIRAAVRRGTLFHVEERGDTGTVLVREGTVVVVSPGGVFKKFVLEAGWRADIKGREVRLSKLEVIDATRFKDLIELRPIAGMNSTPERYVEKYFRWRLGLTPAGDVKADKLPGR